MNGGPKLVLVEFDDELLESLNHGVFDLIKLEKIHLIVVLVVLLWERKDLFEELADLLEVFGAEFLLHPHDDRLEKLPKVSKRNVGDDSLKLELPGASLKKNLIVAVEDRLVEFLQPHRFRPFTAEYAENSLDILIISLVYGQDVL